MTRRRCFLAHKSILASLAGAVSLFSPVAAQAQALNACDLNADGVVDSTDVHLASNMALGTALCTAKVVGKGVCNVVVVQRIANAALGGACVTGSIHSATLNWTASTSTVVGYNVYRRGSAGGPYTKLNSSLVTGVTYTDSTVQAGQTYYYVTTAVDSSNNESVYSNSATALIPSP
jgi:hypothetical protein